MHAPFPIPTGLHPSATRSVWSAWSLLPLSNHLGLATVPASWTHSKRFAQFDCRGGEGGGDPGMNATFPIPTGLHPSAQGCLPSEVLLTKEGQATLGHAPQRFPQPQRGCITVSPTHRCNPVGVDDILPDSPRVASRTRQPWAGRCCPVGVDQMAESRQLVANCHLLKVGCPSVSQLVTNCNQLKTVCVFITQPVTSCYQLKPPTTP
jgi:hypothetical protein